MGKAVYHPFGDVPPEALEAERLGEPLRVQVYGTRYTRVCGVWLTGIDGDTTYSPQPAAAPDAAWLTWRFPYRQDGVA